MKTSFKEVSCDEKIVKSVICQVCDEFKITQKELFQPVHGRENFLWLVAVCLVGDVSGLPPRAIARLFGSASPAGAASAPLWLKEYFELIPGLRKKYEDLRKKIADNPGFSN